MCKKNDAFVFSMGIIAGVIGGIIGGVLFAPKSGEESRKELKETNWKDNSEKLIMLLNQKKCLKLKNWKILKIHQITNLITKKGNYHEYRNIRSSS